MYQYCVICVPMDREPSFYLNKIRYLSRALIVSGMLNIGVLALLSYWIVRERPPTPYCGLKPADPVQEEISLADHRSFPDLIASFRRQPYARLITHLHNSRMVEDGYRVRDLALSALVAFHYFDIGRALSAEPNQKRFLKWKNPKTDQETVMPIYLGLSDLQFEFIIAFSKTENWPITSQGAFLRLQNQKKKRGPDASLAETFFLSPEFLTVELLFRRTETRIGKKELLDIILEGNWDALRQFTDHQRQINDLSVARRQKFLLDYIDLQSEAAAYQLLEIENEFAMKKLDDDQAVALLKLLSRKTEKSEQFALSLLTGARTRSVWQNAASRLYEYAGEPIPEHWNYIAALRRFAPEMVAGLTRESKKITETITTPVDIITNAVIKSEKSSLPGKNLRDPKKNTPGTSSEKALTAITLPAPAVSGKETVGKDKKANSLGKGYADKPASLNVTRSTERKTDRPIAMQQKPGSVKIVAQEGRARYYVVQEGDSLWRISQRFHVDLDTLKNHNQLKSNAINPGITLKIPPS